MEGGLRERIPLLTHHQMKEEEEGVGVTDKSPFYLLDH